MKWEKRYVNSPSALKLLGEYRELNNRFDIDFKIGYRQGLEIKSREVLAAKHSGGLCWSLVSLFHEIVAVEGEMSFENILYGESAYLRPMPGQVQPIQLDQVDDSYFDNYRKQIRGNSLFQAEIGESSKGSFSDQQSYSVLDHYLSKRMDKQDRMVEEYGKSRQQKLNKNSQWLRSDKLKFNHGYSAFYKNFPANNFRTSYLKTRYLQPSKCGASPSFFASQYFERRTRSYQKKMHGIEYRSKLGESYSFDLIGDESYINIGGVKRKMTTIKDLSDINILSSVGLGLAEMLTELINAEKHYEIGFGQIILSNHVIGLIKKNNTNQQVSTYYLFDPNYGVSSKEGGVDALVLLINSWLLMHVTCSDSHPTEFNVGSYRLIKSKL